MIARSRSARFLPDFVTVSEWLADSRTLHQLRLGDSSRDPRQAKLIGKALSQLPCAKMADVDGAISQIRSHGPILQH